MGASAWDQSTTAASNTDIGGVNQDEGCAPSTVNNATRALAAQMKGALIGVTASGTDTYTATLAPAPDALTDGMTVHIRFTNANATTTPTLQIGSLTAKTIVKEGSAALVAGDIPAGHEGELRYNGTNFVLLNPKTGSNAVLTSRSVISGAGLTGGGDLSADRTLAVGAGTGIVVNANDIAIDKATQAEMEAETSDQFVAADNMKYHLALPKAVLSITSLSSASPTVSAFYTAIGTVSCSRSAAGTYSLSWSPGFSSNCRVQAIAQRASTRVFVALNTASTGSVGLFTSADGSTGTDPDELQITIWGNLS